MIGKMKKLLKTPLQIKWTQRTRTPLKPRKRNKNKYFWVSKMRQDKIRLWFSRTRPIKFSINVQQSGPVSVSISSSPTPPLPPINRCLPSSHSRFLPLAALKPFRKNQIFFTFLNSPNSKLLNMMMRKTRKIMILRKINPCYNLKK